jgi:hypothetical protein
MSLLTLPWAKAITLLFFHYTDGATTRSHGKNHRTTHTGFTKAEGIFLSKKSGLQDLVVYF